MLRTAVGVHGALALRGTGADVGGIQNAIGVTIHDDRRERVAFADRSLFGAADRDSRKLDADDFVLVREEWVRIASIANPVADFFPIRILVGIPLVGVGN
jgi:hypothetical protein